MHFLLLTLATLNPLLAADEPAQPREQIGTVQGKPVYRDQLPKKAKDALDRCGQVQALFTKGWAEEYRKKHKTALEPTEAELKHAVQVVAKNLREEMGTDDAKLKEQLKKIEAALADPKLSRERREELVIEKMDVQMQLDGPTKSVARMMLANWKWQKHLYDNFGGGRILWQQMGTEAFDAHLKWLKAHEAKGDFKITDEKLRKAFYYYWEEHRHGAFLTDDKERIREEFLEPDWVLKPAKKP